MRRELARAHSSLRLEEHRNRDLPELDRIAGAEEYDLRVNESVTDHMRFLQDDWIRTVEDWMDPALRAKGDDFTMKRFFDALFGVGVIPVVLTRWEMTGSRDPVTSVAPFGAAGLVGPADSEG